MKQLLLLSGKGGTGKTTIASAFIQLTNAQAFADCDVDAPNLHIVTKDNQNPKTADYFGFTKAFINPNTCIKCCKCEDICRFNAIHNFICNQSECEGCALCFEICPVNAIEMKECASGKLMLYKNESRVFSSAKLKTGSGTSGKLVTAVKKQLIENIDSKDNCDIAIIDGSPGIGCPVIASISGVNMVLIVAEPTVSGIHDLKRIVKTAKQFGTKCAVCINKYDVNNEKTEEIINYCLSQKIKVLGKIPFDKTVCTAVNECKSIVEYPESCVAKAITAMWDEIKNIL